MKIVILIPAFNDFKSASKLIKEIDINISELKAEFSVIVVNDASTEEKILETKNLNNIKSLKLINMRNNKGHARCIAVGLKHISENEDFDYIIPMDGDGEDRPEEIRNFVGKIKDKSLNGINVTLPFKQKIISNLDKIINDAELTGSVNTLLLDNDGSVVGENTDVFGIQAAYLKELDNISNKKASIPSILTVGAVHSHLVKHGLRGYCSLNVECSDALDTHSFAVLIGVGATTVNPYLAIDSIYQRFEKKLFGKADFES